MLKKLGLLALLLLNNRLSAAEGFIWQDKVSVPQAALDALEGVEGLKEAFKAQAAREGLRPDVFPEEVLAEAQAFKEPLDFTGLADLSDIPFVTIDNDYSKDLDQAVAVQALPKGYFKLYYAIADASYFVKEGSHLDWWAKNQVFSTYMPGVDIPVLPRILSENLCSLSQHKDRRALVAIVTLKPNGLVHGQPVFKRAKIHNRAQLSYRLVQEFYDLHSDGVALKAAYQSWQEGGYAQSLLLLRKLGKALVGQAERRNVLVFPERDLRLFEEKGTYFVATYKRFAVEQWNEQVSVLVNHEVAKFIAKAGKPSLHRHHRSPFKQCTHSRRFEKKCLGCVKQKLMAMGYRGYEQLSHFARYSLNEHNPRDMAALSLICQTNYLAEYSAMESGHYGLHQAEYDPFTAPMRRYVDILVHRALLPLIGEKVDTINDRPGSAASDDKRSEAGVEDDDEQSGQPETREELLQEVALLANAADKKRGDIERSNTELLLRLVLSNKVGQELAGTVSHLDRHQMRVKLNGMPFTLTLRQEDLRELGGIAYSLLADEVSARLGADHSVQLGDAINLKILAVNNDEGRVQAVPVFSEEAGSRPEAVPAAGRKAAQVRSKRS